MSSSSPFKFLDSYGKEDKHIFFGRDAEIEQLYELVFQSNLTLVYGESGTGKTSLIQCGLANRFAQSDWFNVYVRRNEDINLSLLNTLKKFKVAESPKSSLSIRLKKRRQTKVSKAVSTGVTPKRSELNQTLQGLYKYYLKPIYLIFDQFEELFILGGASERELFYQSIAQILESEIYCRIIIIMREEMIAQLYDFEKVVPALFEKRIRVEKMSRIRTEEVIQRTTKRFDIQLEHEHIPEQIIDLLSEGEGQVELTYLQVFLDRLYQESALITPNVITYSTSLIDQVGSIENVLGDFLSKQVNAIQKALENQDGVVPQQAVNQVLSNFVTLEGTKRPMILGQISTGKLNMDQVTFIIQQLEQSRILRFENERYELSHDTLAKQVAEQRSADEVAILQIVKLVKDRFAAFEATKTYIHRNEMQLVFGFEKRLKEDNHLSEEEWNFVRRSSRVYKRRLISIAAIGLAVFVVLMVFSIFSYQKSEEAKINAERAEESLRQLELAQEQEKATNYERFLQAGNARMALSDFVAAKEAYETALTFDPDGSEARDSISVAEAKSTSSVAFVQFIQEGDALFNQNNNTLLVNARQKYRAALDLNYNNSLAQSKMDAVNGKLAIAFEQFKDNADVFFNAGGENGYRMALSNYRQAVRIRPGDSYIQRQIREARQKLGE